MSEIESEDKSRDSSSSETSELSEDESIEEKELLSELGSTENPSGKGDADEHIEMKGIISVVALRDCKTKELGRLSFKAKDKLLLLSKSDEEWWEATDARGNGGLVHSSYFKDPNSKEKLKKGKKSFLDQPGIPKNFREPSLVKLLLNDPRYTTHSFLAPKLSPTGLSFREMHWDHKNTTLRQIHVPIQKVIKILKCENIEMLGADFNVASRHVRFCLHNGTKPLSNVHTVRAKFNHMESKVWSFRSKDVSSLENSKCFIRTVEQNQNVGILFEPCIVFLKTKTGELGELCCGWAFLRLIKETGSSIDNDNKWVSIQEGKPFQKAMTAEPKKPFISFKGKSKMPRILIQIDTPTRKCAGMMNLLPSNFLNCVDNLSVLSMYRLILVEALFKNKTHTAELIQSPLLATFPTIFSQPDILDIFKKAWKDKLASESLESKMEDTYTKALFIKLYLETVYYMMISFTFPPFILGDWAAERARCLELEKLNKAREDIGPLAVYLSPGIPFRTLCTADLALNVVGQYCLAP